MKKCEDKVKKLSADFSAAKGRLVNDYVFPLRVRVENSLRHQEFMANSGVLVNKTRWQV